MLGLTESKQPSSSLQEEDRKKIVKAIPAMRDRARMLYVTQPELYRLMIKMPLDQYLSQLYQIEQAIAAQLGSKTKERENV